MFSRLFAAWKALPAEQKDYVFVYAMGIMWAVTYFSFTPPATNDIVVDRLVIGLWLLSTVLGSVIALIGLLNRDNLILERFGVRLVMITPLVYAALQLTLIIYAMINPDQSASPWYSRVALMFLALWLFAFLNKRRRQLKARVNEVKNAPLPNEAEDEK